MSPARSALDRATRWWALLAAASLALRRAGVCRDL